MSSTYLVDFVDKAVFAQSRGNSLVTRRVNKNSRHVKINEIDELKEAMEILFGEQQEQTNSKEKVKFMSQEQSLNPCYYQNQNS